jgi:hypothetical protein
LWGITPYDELVQYLQDVAKLSQPLAQAVAAKLDTSVKPMWEKIWVQLDEQQRHWNKLGLVEDFSSLSERLDESLAEAAPDLAQQPSVAPLLVELLDGGDRWDTTVLLAWLAQSNRLVGVCMQDRDLRESFSQWVAGALAAKGAGSQQFVAPSPEQWKAPLTGLLLQYLLEVRLGWQGEDAAKVAMYLGQLLAHAANDHSYATIVFGDEGRGEFDWRPVRVANGQVEFTD